MDETGAVVPAPNFKAAAITVTAEAGGFGLTGSGFVPGAEITIGWVVDGPLALDQGGSTTSTVPSSGELAGDSALTDLEDNLPASVTVTATQAAWGITATGMTIITVG